MNTLDFTHQHWGSGRTQGITLTLISMHGDADAFTTKAAAFPLCEEGKEQAEKLVEVFLNINDAINLDLEASNEDICARLAPNVGMDESALAAVLDKFLRSDVCCEDHVAEPVAFTLSVTDENGTNWALYPGPGHTMRRYCKLSSIADEWLEQWA